MGDEDMTPTREELLAEILTELGDIEQPRAEDGWFTVQDLTNRAKGYNEDQIRDRMKAAVKQGKYERCDFKKVAYFRKVEP